MQQQLLLRLFELLRAHLGLVARVALPLAELDKLFTENGVVFVKLEDVLEVIAGFLPVQPRFRGRFLLPHRRRSPHQPQPQREPNRQRQRR